MSKTTFDPFTGKLLVALPSIGDDQFRHSVVLICGHDDKGALGLIINRPLPTLTFRDLLENLKIDSKADYDQVRVHCGGFVEMGRGFVIHSADYQTTNTIAITPELSLTATADIIQAIVDGTGPQDVFVALGYAGWGVHQLEQEIISNDWLVLDATKDLIFHTDLDQRWSKALRLQGIHADQISLEGGNA
jgi:putative transcriptional regulator